MKERLENPVQPDSEPEEIREDDGKMSRRNFLKKAGLLAAGALVTGGVYEGGKWFKEAVKEGEKVYHSEAVVTGVERTSPGLIPAGDIALSTPGQWRIYLSVNGKAELIIINKPEYDEFSQENRAILDSIHKGTRLDIEYSNEGDMISGISLRKWGILNEEGR